MLLLYFVFCFNHKTAYEMRIRDWSSDVCASDLVIFLAGLIESNFDMVTIAPGLLPRHISFGDPREPREAHVRAVVKTFEPGAPATSPAERSEERSVGKACGSPCRSRWSQNS